VNFFQTTRRYIPEETVVHCHHCENPKSNNNKIYLSEIGYGLNLADTAYGTSTNGELL
jgi:hypothetical protein